jgi:hypothetical protein
MEISKKKYEVETKIRSYFHRELASASPPPPRASASASPNPASSARPPHPLIRCAAIAPIGSPPSRLASTPPRPCLPCNLEPSPFPSPPPPPPQSAPSSLPPTIAPASAELAAGRRRGQLLSPSLPRRRFLSGACLTRSVPHRGRQARDPAARTTNT